MLFDIDKNNKTISDSDQFLSYEISEAYSEWIDFVFGDIDVHDIDVLKKYLGKENYKQYMVDKIGYNYYYGDSWSSIFEFLNQYQFDHDYYLQKSSIKVYSTYSYNETGPMSWEYYEYYCKQPEKLKKELLNFIIEDFKSTRIRKKISHQYNLPPNEIKVLQPSGRNKKWKYYEDSFPKNLFCISHPSIFGNKYPFHSVTYIESKYEFYPFLSQSNLEDFFLFNELFPGKFEEIDFEIPEFDSFLGALNKKNILTSSGFVKKQIWLKLNQSLLNDLLIKPSFGIEKTTGQYENKNGIAYLDFYWSKNCDNSFESIKKYLKYRNSLFSSLFDRPKDNGSYKYSRMFHLKDYQKFPHSFNKFFKENKWKID